MKVLHINSEKSWRGGEQQMAYLIGELKKHGITSTICCRKNSMMSEYAKKHKLEQFNLSFTGLKFFNALSLRSYVKKNNFDLIHTHTANAHTLAYYATLAGMRTKIIVSKRTDFPVKTPAKFNSPNVVQVLCVSKKIEEITKRYLRDKSKVKTVYSGIDTSRFEVTQISLKKALGLDETETLIGNCSAIAPQKDYRTFVRVAKRLPHYKFVIIGNGPDKEEIRRYIKEQEVKNIFMTGFMPDIEKYLKSLDLFLITSKTEGLGTSILDAMICKLPTVATKAGGIPEIVIDQKTGLLNEIGDDEGIAKNIELMLRDKNLKESLITNAYQNVLTNFTKEATALSTLKYYNLLN